MRQFANKLARNARERESQQLPQRTMSPFSASIASLDSLASSTLRPPPLVELTVSPDDPCNTEIRTADDALVYDVCTRADGCHETTVVRDALKQVVARREGASAVEDEITIRNVITHTRLVYWLRACEDANREYFEFEDAQAQRYRWIGKWTDHHWSLELFVVDARDDLGPIAWFNRSYSTRSASKAVASDVEARFILSPRAMEMQDLCVVSALFLEKNLRHEFLRI